MIEKTESDLFRELCEKDLAFFVEQFFKVLEPETDFETNWHIDVICRHLEAVRRGEVKNLNINIPPRTIKSVLVNVLYPCWVWTTNPTYKFISSSHSATLSTGFNMKRRQIIKSDAYQYYWPVTFLDDADTQKFFKNTDNGFMMSVSVGGSVTGEGADCLIMDDALNAEDANSEQKRTYANEWYSSTFYNRLKDKKTGTRINVMQRLHQKDLTGHIKEKYNFEHLVIPMQKKEGQVQTSLAWKDPRRVGEFIHPNRYSEKEKADEYKGLGAYGWAGQMQQEPSPDGGGIIKKDWIRIEDISHIERGKGTLISVDATFKDNKGSDYVVMQLWTQFQSDFVLVDMIRGKWDFTKTIRSLETFWAKYEPDKVVIEDKANGPAIISLLKGRIRGIKPINPKDSKVARVHAVSHFFECGNIIVNKDLPQLEEFVDELVMFPKAQHDDMVDAMSQAIQELKTKDSVDLIFA